MKYLIDTQVLIWFQLNSKRLKSDIYTLLTDKSNQILISDVSLYEVAIKQKINKLPELIASISDIIEIANQDNFKFLSISHNHIIAYDSVPYFDFHKDPFDRLIIATALSEEIPIISADEKFQLYKSVVSLIEA